jgi:hypothetical protein
MFGQMRFKFGPENVFRCNGHLVTYAWLEDFDEQTWITFAGRDSDGISYSTEFDIPKGTVLIMAEVEL